MGLVEDVTSREGVIASMQDVLLKQFLFTRNLSLPVVGRLGAEGHATLAEAFRQYGAWRGENIRMSLAAITGGHGARQLLAGWDSCEFALADIGGGVVLSGDSARASIALPEAPGRGYFAGHGQIDLLERYWPQVLAGIARGYDERIRLEASGAANTPWVVSAAAEGAEGGGEAGRDDRLLSRLLAAPEKALALVRQSSRNAGALYFFVAREVIRRYDALGEQLVREGVRGIGRERGGALKEKHLREGKPLNLKTLMLDWDGPLISTWVFREGGHLSEGTWHQDCRYCPYADVWAEFGHEGLALGYLYDIELHTTMYQTYHPGTIVRWEALKTRGDHLCKFRFSIPELARPDDPKFAEKPAG